MIEISKFLILHASSTLTKINIPRANKLKDRTTTYVESWIDELRLFNNIPSQIILHFSASVLTI